MYDGVNIRSSVIYLCIILNLGDKVYNQMITETLKTIHLGHPRDFFS